MVANPSQLRSKSEQISWILGFIAVIWVTFILDIFFPLERLGLVPRQISGLFGVAGMHFLHGSWSHLISNSIPLLVLLVLLAGSKANPTSIVITICLIGGIILWVIGRPSLHIGASLLVFGLASFLVVAGFIEKKFGPLLISLMVMLIYGGALIQGLFPFSVGVSWEGHLSGLIAGVICARVFLTQGKRKQSL